MSQRPLSESARVVLYRLQSARGNALYLIPSFASPEDRAAIGELEAAEFVQLREIRSGIIERTQAKLTEAGRAAIVENP